LIILVLKQDQHFEKYNTIDKFVIQIHAFRIFFN